MSRKRQPDPTESLSVPKSRAYWNGVLKQKGHGVLDIDLAQHKRERQLRSERQRKDDPR